MIKSLNSLKCHGKDNCVLVPRDVRINLHNLSFGYAISIHLVLKTSWMFFPVSCPVNRIA